jgi:hypothetical protein
VAPAARAPRRVRLRSVSIPAATGAERDRFTAATYRSCTEPAVNRKGRAAVSAGMRTSDIRWGRP